MKNIARMLSILILATSSLLSQVQGAGDSLLQAATLEDCIRYGLAHQPSVQRSVTSEQIADQEVKSKLADWFPQVNLSVNVQHNYKLPVSFFQGNLVHIGVTNTSTAAFSVSQVLFDRDVLLASSTAGDVRKAAEQTTRETRISVTVNVTKAYYAVLLNRNQIDLVNEDIARLEQSLKDSYSQYKAGVVDRTDYMQATIALNNARAELRQDQEQLNVSYANLKQQMGYPPGDTLTLRYDMTTLENDVAIDTAEPLRYRNRIEYELLQTEKRLQEANLSYNAWSFLPSLSAYGAYNMNFQNTQLSQLYQQDFPNSFVGLQLAFPLFQGGKRIHEIEQAKLELELLEDDQSALESSMSTEYAQALAGYKGNLTNYQTQKENLKLAGDVYDIVALQYKSGVKAYLDLITAETNLRLTQTNYLNALYQVLSSKVDLQKALGTIHD